MPTMSLPLRARGKPCAWMAVGSLKFCCISTSRTYSTTKKDPTLLVRNLHFVKLPCCVFIIFAYGETEPGGSLWWVLGSLCLEQWFPSSCDTPPARTEHKTETILVRPTQTVWLYFKVFSQLVSCLKRHQMFQEYLTHSLHFWMFTVKVFFKLGQLVQVPSLLA